MLVEISRVILNSILNTEVISEQTRLVNWLRKHKRVSLVLAKEDGYYYLELNYHKEEFDLFASYLILQYAKEYHENNNQSTNGILVHVPNKPFEYLKYIFDYAFATADHAESTRFDLLNRGQKAVPFTLGMIKSGITLI